MAAVIFDVVINLAKNIVSTRRALYIILMAAAFAAKIIFGMEAMTLILVCLAIGLADLAADQLKAGKTIKTAKVMETVNEADRGNE